jgi:hypothetical protein
MEIEHHVVVVVRRDWQDKTPHCGRPGCDECRVIDKVTQGSGSSVYHAEYGSKPWEARVRDLIVIEEPTIVFRKPYRIWIIELRQHGPITEKFVIETVVEHWSVQRNKWCY